jgi:hypothetical protein
MKTFWTFLILVTLLFWSMDFSVVKADTGGDPPIVYILDDSFMDIDNLELPEDQSFILHGYAMGQIPLSYFWYESGILIATGAVLSYNFSDAGDYTIELEVIDANGLSGFDYVSVTVLPVVAPPGDICGTVTQTGSTPLAGVEVSLLDVSSVLLGDPVLTDASGSYSFTNLEAGVYSVSIMTPLGFLASPSETVTGIEPNTPCTQVDFELTPTVLTNDCKGMGYWKHQFSVYLTGRGNAQETEADLNMYLDEAYNHFGILGLFEGMGDFGFEEAHAILSVKGNRSMESKARKHLFTLLLNFASGRIGNATVISADNRDAADAVTYVTQLILDGDETNDELAKDICEEINHGQMLGAGIVPESNVVYKFGSEYTVGGLELAKTFALHQNFPNPGNPSTSIVFDLAQDSPVRLEIFDVSGHKIRTLINESRSAGTHQIRWTGEDDLGNSVASGLYIYRIQAGDFVQSKKMLFVK